MAPQKSPPTQQRLATQAVAELRRLLPPGWALSVDQEPNLPGGGRPDMVLDLTAPDGATAVFVVDIRRSGTGATLRTALDQLGTYAADLAGTRPLFVAPWLSERSRDLLTEAGVGYLDSTGNARLVADQPGLFISARGAARNPWPTDSALKSLRGRGAARAVRALVDHRPPYGIRELAERTGASAATLSRVVDLLESEDLIARDATGGVAHLDWQGALRRWARDYDVQGSNDATNWLQPRGLAALSDSLRSADLRYALTGSLAVQELAPYAPARLAMLYVDSIDAAVEALDLRPVDAGANLLLLVPFDDVVYARKLQRSGLAIVNPSQLAVDLLTGPGRSPSEAEELLGWMEENTDAWRA